MNTVDYASVVDVHRVMASTFGSPIDVGISDSIGILQAASDILPDVLTELSSARTLYSSDQVRAILLVPLALRKWRLSVGLSNLDSLAVDGFLERNHACGDRSSVPRTIRDEMRRLLRAWLPPLDYHPMPRLGPGAVAERYHYRRKRERLLEASLYYRELFTSADWSGTFADHECARLCAVPKDWNKARLITVEPYFHTLTQQAARSYIWECFRSGPFPWRYVRRGALRYKVPKPEWLHFWDIMPRHQRTQALRGSKDGSVATIDLSDASDGISYDLVADVFPPHVMAWIDVSRSPYFSDDKGNVCNLNIYAGMGNATTFIVETLLFLAYATACQRQSGLPDRPITVFGDDIACSTELYERLVPIECGAFFKINKLKSFSGNSPFRESCGTFAYNGDDLGIFRFRGYDRSWNGQLALSELWRAITLSPYRTDRVFASYIADNSDLPNYAKLPENYPGVTTYGRPFEPQELRWNRDTQTMETLLPVQVEGHSYLRASEPWMVPASNIEAIHTTEDYIKGRVRRRVHIPNGRVLRHRQWLACH